MRTENEMTSVTDEVARNAVSTSEFTRLSNETAREDRIVWTKRSAPFKR
ncbi:hypothetical protein [Pseudomonas sp. MPB23]